MKTFKKLLAVMLTMLIFCGTVFVQASAEGFENVTIKLYDYGTDMYVVVIDDVNYDSYTMSFSFYQCDAQGERELIFKKRENPYNYTNYLHNPNQYRISFNNENFNSSAASYVMVISNSSDAEQPPLCEISLTYSDLLGGNPIFCSFRSVMWLDKYQSSYVSFLYPVGYSGGKVKLGDEKNYNTSGLGFGKIFRISYKNKITAFSEGEAYLCLYSADNELPVDKMKIMVSDNNYEPNNFQGLLRITFLSIGSGLFEAITAPIRMLLIGFFGGVITTGGLLTIIFSPLLFLFGFI